MAQIKTEADLHAAILQFEIKQAEEKKLLKEEFGKACEQLKPINLIKSTFRQAASSPEIKDNILSASVGLGAGHLSRLLVGGISHNPIAKLLGIVLEFGVAKVVAQNPDMVKSVGKGIVKFIKNIKGKKSDDAGEVENHTQKS